jgi:hypothetical protein
MKLKKLLEILSNTCKNCNKPLTNVQGRWQCKVQEGDLTFYHLDTTNQQGNLSQFSISYSKYKIHYYEAIKTIEVFPVNKIPIWNSDSLIRFKCDNIEQFINNKDIEIQIEKLLILC